MQSFKYFNIIKITIYKIFNILYVCMCMYMYTIVSQIIEINKRDFFIQRNIFTYIKAYNAYMYA